MEAARCKNPRLSETAPRRNSNRRGANHRGSRTAQNKGKRLRGKMVKNARHEEEKRPVTAARLVRGANCLYFVKLSKRTIISDNRGCRLGIAKQSTPRARGSFHLGLPRRKSPPKRRPSTWKIPFVRFVRHLSDVNTANKDKWIQQTEWRNGAQ